ncbi:putative matrix protein [paper mulberry mosaic associated virus]|uniref:Matrix protein n=1 Tax=paper mulberry mosaic associated virus TaxID=3071215 RepID=A0AAE7JL66_9RHAB|nr:putative matrix protein [paper mulberry mosaic associated virus]QNO38993.1 putative matrix protein [paper mulberry mosaic associated virus]
MVNFIAVRLSMTYKIQVKRGTKPSEVLPKQLLANLKESLKLDKNEKWEALKKFLKWYLYKNEDHYRVTPKNSTSIFLSDCTEYEIKFPNMRIFRSQIPIEDFEISGSAEYHKIDPKSKIVLESYLITFSALKFKNKESKTVEKFIKNYPEKLMRHDLLEKEKETSEKAPNIMSSLLSLNPQRK